MNDSRGIEERGDEDMAPIGSRLPEDPAYWHTLADQIVTDAVPVLEEYRAKQGIWWSSLAHRSPALAAAAVLAIAAGAFMLVRESAATESSPHDQVARAIGPTDPVARLFLSEGTPPRVESLLAVVSQTAERATEETDR